MTSDFAGALGFPPSSGHVSVLTSFGHRSGVVGVLEIDRTHVVAVGVASSRVVAGDPPEDGLAALSGAVPAAFTLEGLALERGIETLREGVVGAGTDRAA